MCIKGSSWEKGARGKRQADILERIKDEIF
jgi:hypothetical protein